MKWRLYKAKTKDVEWLVWATGAEEAAVTCRDRLNTLAKLVNQPDIARQAIRVDQAEFNGRPQILNEKRGAQG